MKIKELDQANKKIIIDIPLTTTSGKTRVKERDNIFGYGLPFASRTNPFNQKNYIEWQIGYDVLVPQEKKSGKNKGNFNQKELKLFNLSTLKKVTFNAYNNKNKALYELSEYLYYFHKWGVVSPSELEELKNFVENLEDSNLLDNNQHCQIKRTHPKKQKINSFDFQTLTIEYPQLLYKFDNYEIIAEITIKEKQRAIGTQPMLYFCFPITELKTTTPLIGRTAEKKEFANFVFDKNNYKIIIEMIKIFGMLSPSHKFDTLAILETVVNN
jgi:hypothetical protein